MKKLLFIPLLTALLLPLACNKGSEYHKVQVMNGYNDGLHVYADQEWDSLAFETTESYTLTTDASWCIIPEANRSLTIPYANALVSTYTWLQFEANTTGEERATLLHIHAGEYSIAAPITQHPYLCVTTPMRFGEVLMPLNVAAAAEQANVSFTTFSDWTLTTDCAWLTVGTPAGRAGEWDIAISVQPNTTEEDRSATLTLTSRGISEDITIVQAHPVEE